MGRLEVFLILILEMLGRGIVLFKEMVNCPDSAIATQPEPALMKIKEQCIGRPAPPLLYI